MKLTIHLPQKTSSNYSSKYQGSTIQQFYFIFLIFILFFNAVDLHVCSVGCKPPHSNEPVHFWIAFRLLLTAFYSKSAKPLMG